MKIVHAVIIDSADNVATLCEAGNKGDVLIAGDRKIELLRDGTLGDKIALVALAAGDKIIKYNAVMGSCTQAVALGEWVHSHNLESDYMKSASEGDASHV